MTCTLRHVAAGNCVEYVPTTGEVDRNTRVANGTYTPPVPDAGDDANARPACGAARNDTACPKEITNANTTTATTPRRTRTSDDSTAGSTL
ncbi:MAG: hypothetical protein J0H43_15765 [Actinobacteria bacterium]|nr:hypothetical protein [Actinomycetota bacterium]